MLAFQKGLSRVVFTNGFAYVPTKEYVLVGILPEFSFCDLLPYFQWMTPEPTC